MNKLRCLKYKKDNSLFACIVRDTSTGKVVAGLNKTQLETEDILKVCDVLKSFIKDVFAKDLEVIRLNIWDIYLWRFDHWEAIIIRKK